MANKRRREIANGAPEIPQTTDNLQKNTINESESGAQTFEPSNHGSPAGYEQLREQRIKENLERLQKLGIVDLSLKLKSAAMSAYSLKRTPRNYTKTPLLATELRRRSLRLQNDTPVTEFMELTFPKRTRGPRKEPTLMEIAAKAKWQKWKREREIIKLEILAKQKLRRKRKRDNAKLEKVEPTLMEIAAKAKSQKCKRERESIKLEKLAKRKQKGKRKRDYVKLNKLAMQKQKRSRVAMPEIYTDEHEKLLGRTKLTWELGVDGWGEDGKRIYDPINGKTCHQCRQKTLGHRTSCRICQMVQGQFCGDCLYMRYGEHVLEANENPDWICPVCRGICNCSICRKAKGWPATGLMYRKILSLGYKSVAHYLVATKRAPPEKESEYKVQKTPNSAKRSLTFKNMEVPADGLILDYVDKEIGESEDENETSESEDEEETSESEDEKESSDSEDETEASESEDEKESSECEDEKDGQDEGILETDKASENGDEKETEDKKKEASEILDEKDEQDVCEMYDTSMPNFGELEFNPDNIKEEANADANEGGLKTAKTGENVDEKETVESRDEMDASEGVLKTAKTGENVDEKETVESKDEMDASEGGFKTAKSGENVDEKETVESRDEMDASEGVLETPKTGENVDEKETVESKDEMDASEGILETAKTGENVDEKETVESKDEMDASEGILETAKTGENVDEKELDESKDEMDEINSDSIKKEVGSYNAGFVASRTRSSCNKENPDVSEGILKMDKAGENEVISNSKGYATKSSRKAKLTSPQSVQDSIARRLRSRINKT